MNTWNFRIAFLALTLWFTIGAEQLALAEAANAKTHRLAQKDKTPKAKAAARGKNATTDAKKTEEKKPEAKADDEQPVKKNSTENRKGKTAVVLAEIGLVDLLHSGVGAQVGYFLSPKLMLEADYLHASFSFLGYQSNVNVATVRTKLFVGNSFYVQGGLGIRNLESVDDSLSLFGTDSYNSTFTSSYLVGEIGIGNRWQFSAFTIGCDWVGYLVPVAKLSSSEKFSGTVSETTKADDRQTFDKQSENGNLLLVRFHLGWAF